MKLYTYANSSAAYRVRIALNLKGLTPEPVFVSLVRNGGEQHSAMFKAINAQELVPALEHDGRILTQSLSIIEYLDEIYPSPELLPRDPAGRARVRQIAMVIACDIHPVNNLSVRQYLKAPLAHSEEEVMIWYRHWIDRGFQALEQQLSRSPDTGRFAHGDTPTMADICIVPQMANARRYNIPVDGYPTLVRLDAEARALTAFVHAAPEAQPDAGR